MPTIIQTTQGTVTGLWGSAIVKGADGHAHPLKLGDVVKRGDVILTSQDGIVELTSDVHAAPAAASAASDVLTVAVPAETPPKAATRNDVDQVIEKLAQDDADAATAAGLAGGDGGEFLPGLRVDRITENLTALGLNNNQESDTNDTPPVGTAAASAAALANIAPSALDGAVSGPENTTLPVALRGVDSDGNVVSVTVTGVPTGGTLLLADGITVVSAGQTLTPAQAAGLLFKPAIDFVGQATVSFFVTDNQGLTSNGATVSLNLIDTSPPQPTNQPPVAVNDSATTPEDTPATGNVLSNDSDPDGNTLTVTQFSLGGVTYAAGATAIVAGVGSLTLTANGAYTFTPEPNYNGPVPVAVYTVSDGVASVTATLTLSVSAVNDAPVAQNDLAATPVNAPTTINVLANDSDVDGDALTVTSASVDPAFGTVTVNPNGTLAFNPANNVSGPVTIQYTISDGQGGTASATVTVNIGPNTPPEGANATVTIAEDGSRSFSAADFGFSDADAGQVFANLRIDALPGAGSLTLSGVAVVAGQVIAVADLGNLVFTPAPNANGNGYASFSFSVQDSAGAFDTAPNQITINVSPVNDPPVAVDDLASTPINTRTTIAVLGNDSDVDGNALTVTSASVDPARGTVTINPDGTLAFTPAGNITGPVLVSYTISDGQGGTASATVTVNVGPNTPPTGTDALVVIAEDGSRSFSATDFGFSDADAGQGFANVRIDTLPSAGTLTLSGVAVAAGQVVPVSELGNLVYTPAPNANGSGYASFSFSVQDSGGAFDTAPNQITIDVTPVADPAVIGGVSSGATVEDTTLTTGGTLTISDPDAGEAAFNPLTNVAGAHGTFSINASGVWTYTLNNADPAVQALGAGQSLPNETFTVTSIDGTSQVVTVTISGTNDAPVALDDTASTPINTPLTSIDVLGNDRDIDGGTLSVTAASLVNPALGSISINPNGTLAFIPASNVSGPVVVNYTVSDGQGGFANATVTIDVGANTPPAGSDATVTVAEDSSRSFSAADFGYSDADAGQGLAQVRIDTLPASGALTLNGVAVTAGQTIAVANLGNLVFTPAPNANGNAYAGFDFSVQDSAGAFDTTPNRLSIAVSAVNDAPVATGTATLAAINEDDPSPPGASVGSLFAARFSDATDQVSGGSSANTLAGVAISNHGVDASKGAWQYSTDGGASWSALPAGSTTSAVTLTGSDWLRFVPAANYNGAATPLAAHLIESGGATIVSGATVDLSAGTGGTTVYSAATVPVVAAINPVNDPPVARNDEGSVTAAQTLTVSTAEGVILSTSTPSGRDTDVEGDALTVAQVSAGTGAPSTAVTASGVTIAGAYGDLLLRSDGSYTYTASRADAVATGNRVDDVFTYQVSDGHGGLANASLTVHVGGAADTLTAPPPTTTALTATLGLNGEYYGYNDFNPGPTSPNRRHADDGVYGNLDRAADVTSIVNGRNAAFGGAAVVGSSTAADANAADARFTARSIDYGTSPTVTGTLGTNPNIAAGGSTAGLTNDNSQLFKFLNNSGGGDAGTITVRQGTGDNDQSGGGPTSGLGRTSDVAMRLTGEAYLAAGLYDIRVYADDGFRLRMDNQTVAAFDDIQSPTTRVYTGVPIDGGLTPLELLYWEQGGNAALRVEFKLSGTPDSAYQVLGSQNLPLFSDANAPVLSDLQDLVAGPTPGSYLVRTGSLLDGGNGDDTLTGSAGRDVLIGGQGKDTLNGGAGDDLIRGGAGHDQLTGGAGHDVFRWSLGDAGTAGTPARDVITDFDNTPHGGDVLDLRDLLVGESHAANTVALPASIGLNNALTITPHEGNLANYLHFSAVGGNTVVEISSTGGFASSYTPAAVDQVITLTGLNLVGSFTSDHQVINDLLQRGKLVTD